MAFALQVTIIALDRLSDRAARGRPRVHAAVYGYIPSSLSLGGNDAVSEEMHKFPC